MRRARFLIGAATLAALVGLASCDRPKEGAGEPTRASASSFSHQFSDDASGYYMPVSPVQADDWLLKNAFIAQAEDFASWESGARAGTFAPIMFEFEDTTSPTTATELGEVRSRQVRVLPTRYQISDDRVVFEGTAEGVGAVSFNGRLDLDALATARRNLGDEAPVLSGTLKVGGRSFNDVTLRWWAGD